MLDYDLAYHNTKHHYLVRRENIRDGGWSSYFKGTEKKAKELSDPDEKRIRKTAERVIKNRSHESLKDLDTSESLNKPTSLYPELFRNVSAPTEVLKSEVLENDSQKVLEEFLLLIQSYQVNPERIDRGRNFREIIIGSEQWNELQRSLSTPEFTPDFLEWLLDNKINRTERLHKKAILLMELLLSERSYDVTIISELQLDANTLMFCLYYYLYCVSDGYILVKNDVSFVFSGKICSRLNGFLRVLGKPYSRSSSHLTKQIEQNYGLKVSLQIPHGFKTLLFGTYYENGIEFLFFKPELNGTEIKMSSESLSELTSHGIDYFTSKPGNHKITEKSNPEIVKRLKTFYNNKVQSIITRLNTESATFAKELKVFDFDIQHTLGSLYLHIEEVALQIVFNLYMERCAIRRYRTGVTESLINTDTVDIKLQYLPESILKQLCANYQVNNKDMYTKIIRQIKNLIKCRDALIDYLSKTPKGTVREGKSNETVWGPQIENQLLILLRYPKQVEQLIIITENIITNKDLELFLIEQFGESEDLFATLQKANQQSIRALVCMKFYEKEIRLAADAETDGFEVL